MTAREPEALGGLVVTHHNHAWYVTHAGSGLSVFSGGLRQRRFAEQARAGLLATGADFMASPREVHGQRGLWAHVARLWMRRAAQRRIDLVTGEYYNWSSSYGQVIPSAEHAARIAAALESYMWS